MANVLGELFSEIAESIRGGLGDIGTMKPNAFPDRIDEIVELLQNAGSGDGGGGSGGSGSSTSTLKIKSGSYKVDANGSRAEVAHGLGTMPDLVIVYIAGAYELDALQNSSGRYLLYTWGIKDSFDASSYGGYAIPGFHTASVPALNEVSSIGVYCPNDEVFQFGNANTTANGRLMPNMSYYWMAFSGMGGGSSADIRYVTFMNDTGTKAEGKKAVAVGDDCADPIARGVFDTPTKESTPQYSYTFSGGWATTPGGGKDANALKAVTEDRTVYANFISTLRTYTLTFCDDDGTVLNTKTYTYGSTPSYTPTKADHLFTGWIPALSVVTGDASYTASWVEAKAFADAAWETIAARSADGTASQFWKVGDKKTFEISGGEQITVVIAGFNHDDLADGSGKAGITLVFDSLPSSVYYWDSLKFGTMYGTRSYMYNGDIHSNLGTVKAYLPTALSAVIKTVTKEVYDDDLNNGNKTTYDQSLWFLSLNEMGYNPDATATTDLPVLGSKYDYFDSFTDIGDTIKNGSCANQKTGYWTRSDFYSGARKVYAVSSSGRAELFSGDQVSAKGNRYQYRIGFCI